MTIEAYKRKRLVVVLVVSGLSLAVVHGVAVELSLYYIFPDLDVLSHFLGGVVVSLAVRIMLYWLVPLLSKMKHVIVTLVAVLCVGVAWEYFEVLTGTAGAGKDTYSQDTILDLVMDVIGGVVGLLI